MLCNYFDRRILTVNLKPALLKSAFIILFYFIGFYSSNAQNLENTAINIRIENGTYRRQFFVDIHRDTSSIFIKYKIRVSEDREKMQNDPVMIKVRKNLAKIKKPSPQNQRYVKLLYELDSIHIALTTFRVDSLLLSGKLFPEYDKMIDSLFATPTDSLQNSGHIYLDGTSFIFKLTNGRNTRKVYANSINKDNHPQLAAFMVETMALYRRLKNDIFLDRYSTAGY